MYEYVKVPSCCGVWCYRAATMPPEAHKAAMKELKRLKKMPPVMPENAMIRFVYMWIPLCLNNFIRADDLIFINKARGDGFCLLHYT